jgi:hypothetical protein
MDTLTDVAGEMLPLFVIIFIIVPGMDLAWQKIKSFVKSRA